jgi:hypothetical protein
MSISEETAIAVRTIDTNGRVAHVDGLDLPFEIDASGVAWVECEPYGSWLGYARPRDARGFARKLHKDGIINDSEIRVRDRKTPGATGRPVTEVWLTRTGATKLATRSNTPRAKALLDRVVAVFDAVLDGRLVPASAAPLPSRPGLPPMLAALIEQHERTSELERGQARLEEQHAATRDEVASLAEKVDAIGEQLVSAPTGMSAQAVASDFGWLSTGGHPHGAAVITAAANNGFYDRKLLATRWVPSEIGDLVPQHYFTAPGVAAFGAEVDRAARYDRPTFRVEPNDTAKRYGKHKSYEVRRRSG